MSQSEAEAMPGAAASVKLQRESKDLAGFLLWIFIIVCLGLFADVLYRPLKALGGALATPEADIGAVLEPFRGQAVAMIPAFMMLAALWTARSVFVAFSQGEVFTTKAGDALCAVGDWLIAAAFTALFVVPSVGSVLNVEGPVWELDRMAVVLLCVGFAIRLIGKAFSGAAAIKAENDQII